MALDRILLSRFRNHRETFVEGTGKFNLLVGENGAGKTNVLEAISLLAPGRGLRRAALADMPAQSGDGGFAVSASLAAGPGEPVQLGTAMAAERPGRRLVQVNGAEAPAIRLGEWLSIGWLTPAMDRLFVEGAGARRRFLDRLVLALEPAHASQAARLENALRERNRLLSADQAPDPRWLDAIESQIAETGAIVAQARAALLERLSGELALQPEAPFARPALAYRPGGPIEAGALTAALREGRPRDLAAGRTLTGPHRDEIAVTMAGKDQPAAECSTGEQKAMLIAIVLAHSALLEHAGEARPRILLLDEVAAHLDPLRREALFDRLREGRGQVWLTGTEPAPFAAIMDEAAVWHVREGGVTRAK
ncbi:DNA replication/repair protein RecF [Novosphingobium sp. PC22D]|uniref:DNA replication/repair protein RecF n=1 Tax=Novosphingobium sp. PC22D TaxID=1962403 RepID=UPI000BEFCC22|nr:DNA replication/repair protein RecF [Novosphingobium sp. PC22D]PEQ14278.1 DNA replication/repair protein RecF [Novosphingobium sp. PC22D]